MKCESEITRRTSARQGSRKTNPLGGHLGRQFKATGPADNLIGPVQHQLGPDRRRVIPRAYRANNHLPVHIGVGPHRRSLRTIHQPQTGSVPLATNALDPVEEIHHHLLVLAHLALGGR